MPTLKEELSWRRRIAITWKHSGAARGLQDSVIRTGVFALPADESPLTLKAAVLDVAAGMRTFAAVDMFCCIPFRSCELPVSSHNMSTVF